MTRELLELAIAIVVITLIIVVLCRAGTKSVAKAGTAKERLGYGYEEEAPQRRRRRRPEAAEGKPEVREEEEEAAEEPVVADAEATAAYKLGLAKTRGGFVAKLGKLFGKKQIDAATVDELEEV